MESKTLNYSDGATMAFDNAVVLMEMANYAKKDENYGVACSLVILSAEEIIKAFFCIQKQYFPNEEIEDFDSIFSLHKVKHRHIQEALIFLPKVLSQSKNIFPLYKKAVETAVTDDGIPLSQQQKDQIIVVVKYMDVIASSPKSFSKDFMQWWNKANNLKNAGFYVGKTTNSWLNPKDIDEVAFLEGQDYTRELLRLTYAFFGLVTIFDGMNLTILVNKKGQ